MSRIVIRESEIRQYVRQLLRESIEAEGAAPSQGKIDRWLQMSPEEIETWEPTSSRDDALDIKNRKLMLLGQDYDRKPFGNLSKGIEKAYRQMKGYPPIIGISGRGAAAAREEIEKCRQQGIEPIIEKNGYTVSRISGENGADISAENTADAIAQRQEMRRQDHAQKMANRNVRVGDREDRARNREIVLGHSDTDGNTNIDRFANNAEDDATTQEWLSMTPEEKRQKAKEIRDKEKSIQAEKNKKLLDDYKSVGDMMSRNRPPSAIELKQRLVRDKQKKTELESILKRLPNTEANKTMIKKLNFEISDYAFKIKDKKKILNVYHGCRFNLNDDSDIDEMARIGLDKFNGNADEKNSKVDDSNNDVDTLAGNEMNSLDNGKMDMSAEKEELANETGSEIVDPQSVQTNQKDETEYNDNENEDDYEEEDEFDEYGNPRELDGYPEDSIGDIYDDDDDDEDSWRF